MRQERVDRGEGEGLTSDEREELAELRRQVRRLSTERDPLKRAVAFWDEGARPVSRYRWVDCQKAEGSLYGRSARWPTSPPRPIANGSSSKPLGPSTPWSRSPT